jgi:hypothetical protein
MLNENIAIVTMQYVQFHILMDSSNATGTLEQESHKLRQRQNKPVTDFQDACCETDEAFSVTIQKVIEKF